MSEKSQPNRIWFWAAPSFAWFSTACSAPLIVHFFVVLFQRDAMKDGQYAIMFPMGGLKRLENRNSLDRETQLKLVTRTAKSS